MGARRRWQSERRVTAPDGSEWVVRLAYFRLPRPGDLDPEWGEFERTIARVPLVGVVAAGALRLVEFFVVPLVAATVGRRPWIKAVRSHPPTLLVWRSAAGASAKAAAAEIADRLGDGVERPLIDAAEWVGREDGPSL
jgi:hypothetical protein